jgi:hypothetical protein
MSDRADLWRQIGFFTPSTMTGKIHVVGAGATGSHIVDTLACMGLENIVVYDFDIVENHNLPNQIYTLADVGKPKVVALQQHIKNKMGFDIATKNEKVDAIENLEGVLILCTDKMQCQKDIFNKSARLNSKAIAAIETRMGIDQGRIYFLDPNNKAHLKKYAAEWYSDEEAVESPCNLRAISGTAKLIASLAASRVIINHKKDNWIPDPKKEDDICPYNVYNKTLICMDGSTINYSWD